MVGLLRRVDNYQLKSQDILHLPSPVGLTKDSTVVGVETMQDGKEAVCLKDVNHDRMVQWLEKDQIPPNLKGVQTGHSLTFEERFRNVDRYCYDVIIRCTGFRFDTSIFEFPIATDGGRAGTKYPQLTAEYESTSAKGLYAAGTLAHIRDFRRSSGGFVHGFRYTARALFKLLEQKNHGVPWPRVEVLLDERSGEGASSAWFGSSEKHATQTLTEKLTDRMDTSSGLYQMFNELCDLVILPRAGARYAALQSGDTSALKAEYLEEVPIDLVPTFVEADREYVLLTMEYGPDFHGHERGACCNDDFISIHAVHCHYRPIRAHSLMTVCWHVLQSCGRRECSTTLTRQKPTSRSSCTRSCDITHLRCNPTLMVARRRLITCSSTHTHVAPDAVLLLWSFWR